MKSNKDFRGKSQAGLSGDLLKRAVKLDPIKKSGKERYAIYGAIEDEDPDEALPRKRESVLDYLEDDEE